MIINSLSDAKLKLGYWYVTHKLALRSALRFFLIFSNLIMGVFSAVYFLKIYVVDHQWFRIATVQLAQPSVNYSTFNIVNQPKPIIFSKITVLKSSGTKYDLLVNMTNPNKKWLSKVSTKFIFGEIESEPKVLSILPGESKYIIEAGVDAKLASVSPQFTVNYTQWEKVRNINSFNRFVSERFNFTVDNIKYTDTTEMNLGTQVPVSGLSFDIENKSLFDYWLVNSQILFKRGGNIVAANVIPLEEFKTGQFRTVDFRIFDNLIGVSAVEVQPDIDLFDKNNIMEDPLVVGELK